MTGVKKILVGVDFSEASQRALERAVQLAKKWEASLVALHVLRDLPYDGARSSTTLVKMVDQLQKEATQALEKLVEKTARDQVEVNLQVQVGIPPHDILLKAHETGADWIVMGREGKGLLEGIFLGHTTDTVVRKSWLPVWVEGRQKVEEIRVILLPTDLSENSRHVLLASLEWAKKFSAKLIFQHVAEEAYVPAFSLIDPKEYEAKMAEIAQDQFEKFLKKLPLDGVDHEKELSHGNAANEIAKFAKKKKADLIILSTHGQSGLAYRLLGNVAAKVLHHAPCSLLMVKPRNLDFSWIKKEILSA